MADPHDPHHPRSQGLSSEQGLENPLAESHRPHPSAVQPSQQSQDPATPRTDAMAAGAFSQEPPLDTGHQAPHSTDPSAPAYDYKPSAVPPTSHVNPDETRPSEASAFPAPPGDVASAEHRRRGMTTRMHDLGHKAADPINALAIKLGSRAFLPTTMDKECDKAAAILTSFCKEGVHGEGHRPATPETSRSRSRDRALLRIPKKVLAKAVGLAIFTSAGAGFQVSVSTGSGILIARLTDGSWGPPSGIQVHALGAGFLVGASIYDCVCVINTREALDAFAGTRVSLGPEVGLVAGPFGVGAKVDVGSVSRTEEQQKAETPVPAQTQDPGFLAAGHKKEGGRRRSSSYSAHGPVFTYVKARGLFAGVHVDGTVITERKEANKAFYSVGVSAGQIIRNETHLPAREAPDLWPLGARTLYEALRRAENRPSEDEVIVPPTEATPAIKDPMPGQERQHMAGDEGALAKGSTGASGIVGGGGSHKAGEKSPEYEAYHGVHAPSADQKAAPEEQAEHPQATQKKEEDPIPRGSPGGAGTAGGSNTHKTTDNLAPYGAGRETYAPAGDQMMGKAEKTREDPVSGGVMGGPGHTSGRDVPVTRHEMPAHGSHQEDPIPRASSEGSGVVGGEDAHKTTDDLPVYGAPRTAGGDPHSSAQD